MADQPHGLGAIPSPPDARDWPVAALYAVVGAPPATLPASYRVPPPYPAVLDQGATPQCVAYSSAYEQGWYDLRDTGPATFDEATFFARIGGTANGAFVRDALDARLKVGYPLVGNAAAAGVHRIAAYYAVPVTRADVSAAIVATGPIILSTPWYSSWFTPRPDGTLPFPNSVVGGHAIVADGYDSAGVWLQNSWGVGWGVNGRCLLPWAYLSYVWEAWKAADRLDPLPAGTHTLVIGAGATVMTATVTTETPPRISGWTKRIWGAVPSSAPCRAPVVLKGTISGQATVAYVTRGTFAGRYVRVGGGVTVIGG